MEYQLVCFPGTPPHCQCVAVSSLQYTQLSISHGSSQATMPPKLGSSEAEWNTKVLFTSLSRQTMATCIYLRGYDVPLETFKYKFIAYYLGTVNLRKRYTSFDTFTSFGAFTTTQSKQDFSCTVAVP